MEIKHCKGSAFQVRRYPGVYNRYTKNRFNKVRTVTAKSRFIKRARFTRRIARVTRKFYKRERPQQRETQQYPEFHGNDQDKYDATEFLMLIEQKAEQNAWDEEATIAMFTDMLDNEAFKW